jgi:hypothetical protein
MPHRRSQSVRAAAPPLQGKLSLEGRPERLGPFYRVAEGSSSSAAVFASNSDGQRERSSL